MPCMTVVQELSWVDASNFLNLFVAKFTQTLNFVRNIQLALAIHHAPSHPIHPSMHPFIHPSIPRAESYAALSRDQVAQVAAEAARLYARMTSVLQDMANTQGMPLPEHAY